MTSHSTKCNIEDSKMNLMFVDSSDIYCVPYLFCAKHSAWHCQVPAYRVENSMAPALE